MNSWTLFILGDITPFFRYRRVTHSQSSENGREVGFECERIHKASKEQIAITKLDVPVKRMPQNGEVGQEQQSLVAIEIIPLTDTVERHYLIRFENCNSCTSRRKIILIRKTKRPKKNAMSN
jgi:two-component system CheB/CheR fusion protein